MDVKHVLALFIFACFWLADGCNRDEKKPVLNTCLLRPFSCYRHHLHRSKRSFQMNGIQNTITLQGDPCSFDTYDYNGDGVITGDELLAIRSINKESLLTHLFSVADDEDLVIASDEFNSMMPLIIPECSNSDK